MFLQKEDLVLADFQDPQKIRCIYHNKRSRYTFFHDFACELTLEEQFKQVSDKYNRRKFNSASAFAHGTWTHDFGKFQKAD